MCALFCKAHRVRVTHSVELRSLARVRIRIRVRLGLVLWSGIGLRSGICKLRLRVRDFEIAQRNCLRAKIL